MPIGPQEPVTSGYYRNIATGEVFFACNCGSQPPLKTLRHIAANRDRYEKAVRPGTPAKPTPTPTVA